MGHGYVNAGGVFFFSSTVSASFENDVLTSNLYFQSGKMIREARFVNAEQWRQLYLQAMAKFGYTLTRREDEVISPCAETSPWQTVKTRLLKHLGEARIDNAQRILAGLAHSNPEADNVLRAHALHTVQPADASCLPVEAQDDSLNQEKHIEERPEAAENDETSCPALVTVSILLSFADTAPVITQALLTFTTSASATPLDLFQLLDSPCASADIGLTVLVAELDDRSYARFRAGIVQQLGSRVDEQLVRL